MGFRYIGFSCGVLGPLGFVRPPNSRWIAFCLHALVQAKQDIHSMSLGDSLNRTPMGQTS